MTEPIEFEKTLTSQDLDRLKRELREGPFIDPDSKYEFRTPSNSNLPITGNEFLSIPKNQIPVLVDAYLNYITTGVTADICKCIWSVHPDDVQIPPVACRDCKHPRDSHREVACLICECPMFQPRRIRMVEEIKECPVHTQAGRILGFFEWVFSK